jgi:hypothetical protein
MKEENEDINTMLIVVPAADLQWQLSLWNFILRHYECQLQYPGIRTAVGYLKLIAYFIVILSDN